MSAGKKKDIKTSKRAEEVRADRYARVADSLTQAVANYSKRSTKTDQGSKRK